MFRLITSCLIVFCVFCNMQSLLAQTKTSNKDTTGKLPKLIINKKPIARQSVKNIINNIELDGGIVFASNGWGIGVQRLKRNEDAEGEEWKGFYAEIKQVYHPKELKTISKLKNPSSDKGPEFLSYVFGKKNVFLPVNIGYQYRKNITARISKNHIRIHGLIGGGLSVGILKPYFLNLAKQQANGSFESISEKYSETNATTFLDRRYIFGYSGFMKGWGDVEVIPGLTTKAAVQFEYATSTKSLFLIEIGGQLNGYLQQIPIMANTANSAIFPSIYVSIIKGARWFKPERD